MRNKSFTARRLLCCTVAVCLLAFIPKGKWKPISRNWPADFLKYTDTIAGTKVQFDMVPVPAGIFEMGSAATEKGHQPEEGPVHKVQVDSFWLGKLEVSWDEFELFVDTEWDKQQQPKPDGPDAITRPSPPFTDMSFGMGKYGYPAVNMTQFAALAYCRWLTAKTGHFYRLPTEAEWEYACRANSTTAYSFGDDAAQLDDYAWYDKNSKGRYQKIGTKKPNAWGLYDMHGSVAEWTLDQYLPDYYTSLNGKTTVNPWAVPQTLYPRTVRGGSWDDAPENLRSAARLGSSVKLKKQDPQIPKSNWWNTDASFVGFRLLRPVKQPTAAEINAYFAPQPMDY